MSAPLPVGRIQTLLGPASGAYDHNLPVARHNYPGHPIPPGHLTKTTMLFAGCHRADLPVRPTAQFCVLETTISFPKVERAHHIIASGVHTQTKILSASPSVNHFGLSILQAWPLPRSGPPVTAPCPRRLPPGTESRSARKPLGGSIKPRVLIIPNMPSLYRDIP